MAWHPRLNTDPRHVWLREANGSYACGHTLNRRWPEVGFEEISIDLLQARFLGATRAVLSQGVARGSLGPLMSYH
jgi:hypothetical protein